MKKMNPEKKRKAVVSTEKLMRDIEPFLAKKIRLPKHKVADWFVPETHCVQIRKNGAQALFSEA